MRRCADAYSEPGGNVVIDGKRIVLKGNIGKM